MPMGYLPLEQAILALALTHAALGESDEALKLYGKRIVSSFLQV
jgi:hypothetical protein